MTTAVFCKYRILQTLRARIVGTFDQGRADIWRLLHESYVAVDMTVEDYEKL